MAIRPVFIAMPGKPYMRKEDTEFEWFPGTDISQKRKSIRSLHAACIRVNPGIRILEISSASEEPVGVELSAFNLMFRYHANLICTVESAYQSSKVFEKAGHLIDLLDKPSGIAAEDPRTRPKDDRLLCYRFRGTDYPIEPDRAFYDWLYCNAVLAQCTDVIEDLAGYDGFTDIAFNPQTSANCQARAAAMLASLIRLRGLNDALRAEIGNFKTFLKLLPLPAPPTIEPVSPRYRTPNAGARQRHYSEEHPGIEPGAKVEHITLGRGVIDAVQAPYLYVSFEMDEKRFGFPQVFESGFLKLLE